MLSREIPGKHQGTVETLSPTEYPFLNLLKIRRGEGEVLNMSQVNCIRDKRKDGYSIAEISRELSIDEKTVRKYLKMKDFSPKKPVKQAFPTKLDPYKEQILQWMEDDKGVWAKQQHTAKRMHERLQEMYEAYDCSYILVQRFMKKVKEERRSCEGFQELVWHPGESQADFGEVECLYQGKRERKKFLTLSFPYSNNSMSQVFDGENAECVCQGLKNIFEEMGGVPPLIIFDNATGVGRKIGEKIREAKLFAQFRAHYRFSVRFTNPNSGNEKGHVENKVGYTRRNWFVPVPQFDDMQAYNTLLLSMHLKKAEEPHYKKLIPIKELFVEDSKAFLELAQVNFDVVRYVYVKADGYGKVQIDGNHYYSSCPEYGGRTLLIGIRALTIEIYQSDMEILVSHPRRYGKDRTDSVDHRTSLAVLSRNVGAWPNSGLREMVPASVRLYLDHQEKVLLKEALRTIYQISKDYDVDHAIRAFELAITQDGQSPLADAAIFAARMADLDIDGIPESGPDLAPYDRFLTAGGAM